MKKKQLTIGLILALLIAAIAISASLVYAKKKDTLSQSQLEELYISREEIAVPGLAKEYHLFFMADSHISLCDDRDAEVLEKAQQRQAAFCDENGVASPETFDKLVKASNTLESDLFIMGGDIIDSAMYASIDYLKDELGKLKAPYLYSLGNHDFEYGEEYFSDAAYEDYLPRLDTVRNEGTYQTVEYDDLIIFAANDKNNQIDKGTVDGLKAALETGKPVVVVLHVPIEPLTGDNSLLQQSIDVWGPSKKGRSRVLLGKNSCKPKEDTQEFIDLITAPDSMVQLVLGGHIHFYHKDNLNERLTQIVTGAAYEKHALFVTLKPE